MEKNRIKKRSLLYQQVETALTDYIDDNNLQPGDKFPPERKFVESLGVSRNVLREAFHVLESRGVVVSHQGKGRFLRRIPERSGDFNVLSEGMTKNLERYSLLEAYELRQVLETYGIGIVAENASQIDLKEIESAYDNMAQQFEIHKETVGEFDLHQLYIEKTGNLYLMGVMDYVFSTILDFMHHNFLDIYMTHHPEESLKSHRKIIDALHAKDIARARCEMNHHLESTIVMIKQNAEDKRKKLL